MLDDDTALLACEHTDGNVVGHRAGREERRILLAEQSPGLVLQIGHRTAGEVGIRDCTRARRQSRELRHQGGRLDAAAVPHQPNRSSIERRICRRSGRRCAVALRGQRPCGRGSQRSGL